MQKKYSDPKLAAIFLLDDEYNPQETFEEGSLFYKFLWNRSNKTCSLELDGQRVLLQQNELLCATPLQKISAVSQAKGLEIIQFNREFYCIEQHDHEVSCYGLLFYGSPQTMHLALNAAQATNFDLWLRTMQQEFDNQDIIQGEMLRVLLKRWIVKCTQIAKNSYFSKEISTTKIDIIRQFHILVESHYKHKKQVADYAALLHKSPKTLANLFLLQHHQSPLQVIHERISLEAKRLLLHTNKNITEIALELGFEPKQFAKFFKKMAGISPLAFKEKER